LRWETPFAISRHIMRGTLHLWIALGAIAVAHAEFPKPGPANPRLTGAPFVRTWTPEDYAAAPVNYDLLQHPHTGFIYVANDYGVLEFDGATWRLIELPNGNSARVLAVDARGQVLVGGHNEIALLAPDEHGTLRASSLLGRLPVTDRTFGALAFAISTPAGIYFATPDRLFLFDETGYAHAWTPPRPIAGLFWFEDTLHCTTSDGGLFAFAGQQFLPTTPAPSDRGNRDKILALRTAPDGGWTVLTSHGPARWAGRGAPLVAMSPLAPAYFQTDPATSAAFLRDGRMAFGRPVGGVTIFDSAGSLLETLDRSQGLLGNRVEDLHEDAEGGLWVVQRAGLTRLQIDSPYARHGVAEGVHGRPRALHRHEGVLYLAHNEGGARRDDATGQFQPIGGLEVGLKRFLSVGPRLLATSNVLLEIKPDAVPPPLARLVFTPLIPVPGTPAAQPWLLGGGTAGVFLLEPDHGAWRVQGALTHVPSGAESLLATPDGFVWGMAVDGRIWRMDFRAGPALDVPVTVYGPERGVPPVRRSDEGELSLLGSDILATSGAWILRFDRTADRFVPETRIAGLPAGVGATRAHVDARGDLWLQLGPPGGQLVHIRPDGPGRWRAMPLPVPAVAGLVANRIYHDEPAQTLWLASQGALVSVDLGWRQARAAIPPRAHLRRVETAAGETIFSGATLPASTTSHLIPNPGHTTLRFTFVAAAFAGDFLGRPQTQYRTRIEGLEPRWTPWSGDTVREVSNLPFRPLTFHVEARGPDGQAGPATTWAFAIAPPWWRTPWAHGGYVALGLLAVAGLVRWRTGALRRRTDQLQALVDLHTGELRKNNAELARLHALERDEKLAARLDEEKARLEMLRYQLNPHFLYNALASISGTALTNPPATRTMAQRLADFCRLTLTRADGGETLREELRLLQSYLAIEQARWGDSLQVEIDASNDALDRRVPTFLLLPLLENAIKHGGETTRGILRIRLAIRPSAGGGLAIEVANTGTWDPSTPRAHSTGIGLENLRRRLARYYPGAHTFTIGPEDDFVVARLTLATQTIPPSAL
jgi:hypothetical protein